jgi:hypothetical protein
MRLEDLAKLGPYTEPPCPCAGCREQREADAEAQREAEEQERQEEEHEEYLRSPEHRRVSFANMIESARRHRLGRKPWDKAVEPGWPVRCAPHPNEKRERNKALFARFLSGEPVTRIASALGRTQSGMATVVHHEAPEYLLDLFAASEPAAKLIYESAREFFALERLSTPYAIRAAVEASKAGSGLKRETPR